jgi:hypothetical protein
MTTPPDTFAAGIEAAAKWHEEKAMRYKEKSDQTLSIERAVFYFDICKEHEQIAQQIRNLKREPRHD